MARSLSSVGRLIVLLLVGALVMIYLSSRGNISAPNRLAMRNSNAVNNEVKKSSSEANEQYGDVSTAKGNVSFSEIETNVFNKLGFAVERIEGPFAVLKRPMTCSKVFDEWTSIANTYDPKRKPPLNIPEDQMAAYTLNGYARLEKWYLNDVSNAKGSLTWTEEHVEAYMKGKNVAYSTYTTGSSVGSALRYYSKETVKGKKGLVVGSLSPWVEAICLINGAAQVITADYQKIVSTHPQLSFLHVPEMAKNWQKYHEQFDFIVSFSSIEHSGLGRYGDPSDPIGDLREMDKVKCFLKKGGLMFLGLPTASDMVVFNAHRVYGRIRLSMLFEGFEFVNMFNGDTMVPSNMSKGMFDLVDAGAYVQPTFVLRRK